MSLISDALKRQEQLHAPGTGAAQREVAAARPLTGNREQGIGNGEPLNRQTGKTSDTLNGSASSAAQRDNPAPHHKPSNRQTVKPSNPFLARERAAARRPAAPVLLMPVIGLLMLLVLLFLRREFVPSQPQAAVVKKVESEILEEESSAGPGIVPAATPAEHPGGPGAVPAATPIDIPKDDSSVTIDSNRTQSIAVAPNQHSTLNTQLSTSNSLSTSAASASRRETSPPPEPSNGQTVKPSNQAVEAPPQQPAWPTFTLTGIAVGRERIAVLSTGEMLLAGEMSKCGVKVKKVNAANVVFAWGGETKTLRKGEHSDKPAD